MLDENGRLYDENTKYWGIMGSNYCKNITLDGCKLSRFDAHQGVLNATVRNSVLGHHGIKLIGSGTALIENTIVLYLGENEEIISILENNLGYPFAGIYSKAPIPRFPT